MMIHKEISRLEILPNELIYHLFRYIPSNDLVQIFFYLNLRFQHLIQTFPFLSYTPSIDDDQHLVTYRSIRALIVNRGIEIDLNYFCRIRFLILRFPTETSINQMTNDLLPSLEHFRINHIHSSLIHRIPHLCQMIFCNQYPRLISCYLFQWGTISQTSSWIYSSLKIFKIGSIDLITYQTILSICPNLFSLQCSTILPSLPMISIHPHHNLKQLIIKTTPYIPSCDDQQMQNCLSIIPYLEYLRIYRTDQTIPMKYHWLGSMIACYLPCLLRFEYFFHFNQREFLHPLEMMRIQREFIDRQGKSYQSRLILF